MADEKPKQQLTLEMMVKRNSEVLMHNIDKDLVLIHPNGRYWGMEAIGAHIWNLMEEPVVIGTLVSTMQESYDGDPEMIKRQVLNFVVAMCRRRLAIAQTADGQELGNEEEDDDSETSEAEE